MSPSQGTAGMAAHTDVRQVLAGSVHVGTGSKEPPCQDCPLLTAPGMCLPWKTRLELQINVCQADGWGQARRVPSIRGEGQGDLGFNSSCPKVCQHLLHELCLSSTGSEEQQSEQVNRYLPWDIHSWVMGLSPGSWDCPVGYGTVLWILGLS